MCIKEMQFQMQERTVKAITLRDIPEPLANNIAERSRRSGKSFNRTIIDMLSGQEAANGKRRHHDLDHLAGTWSAEEAEAFDKNLKEQRSTDAELWS